MTWCPVVFVVVVAYLCGIGPFPVNLSAAPILPGTGAIFEDSCDVTVWDSTATDKSVRRVALKCADGSITWRSPYGGLQVAFMPPGSKGRHFEVCFVASAAFAALRLSVEQEDALLPVYVLNAPNGTVSVSGDDNEEDKCFRFTRNQHPVTLYAEVDAAMTSLAVGRVKLEYSVRRVTDDVDDESRDDKMAECRPCSNEELLEHICSADFAVDGQVVGVSQPAAASRMTRVLVSVINVVHKSKNFIDFLDRRAMMLSSPSSLLTVPSDLDDVTSLKGSSFDAGPLRLPSHRRQRRSLTAPTSGPSIAVNIPSVCQVHDGDGRFLFVGSVHLRRSLRMTCAPRSEEFWRLWIGAVAEGRNPCSLNPGNL